MVTQADIARRVGIDVSSVNKILNRKPGSVFRKETVRKVFKLARQLGYKLDRLKHHHRREHARKMSSFPLEVSIYLADGSLYDRGQAVMRDVSLSGALLSGMLLTSGKGIPLQPHSLGIRVLDGPLKDFEIRSKPVRIVQREGAVYLAVAFEAIHDAALSQLRQIV